MKKLLLASCALAMGLVIAARAADLTPFTGPQDPSQLNANLNALEQQIRTGVNGVIASMGSTVSSTATTIEQTSLPRLMISRVSFGSITQESLAFNTVSLPSTMMVS